MHDIKKQDFRDVTTDECISGENYGPAYTDEYGEIYPPYYYSMGKDYSLSQKTKKSGLIREEEKENINMGDIKYIIAFILIIWILSKILSKLL